MKNNEKRMNYKFIVGFDKRVSIKEQVLSHMLANIKYSALNKLIWICDLR